MKLPTNTVPFCAGAAIGIVSIGILSFANGWIVSSQKMMVELEKANVSVQAEICATRAEKALEASNNSVDLQGYQATAREAREELARSNVTELEDNPASTSTIVSACATLLNKGRS